MLGFPALPGPLRSPASSPRRITPMDWKSPRFAKFQGSVPKNYNFNRHRVTTEAVSSSSMHRGRLQDAPFYPVLGRTWLGIQKTAMGSQGSQVKFGRSQSGKVISESPESPNVHSSTGQKYIYTSKRHSKRWPKGVGWCWVGTGDPSCYSTWRPRSSKLPKYFFDAKMSTSKFRVPKIHQVFQSSSPTPVRFKF